LPQTTIDASNIPLTKRVNHRPTQLRCKTAGIARRGAYSLIELLIVIAIMGIIAVTAMPALSSARTATVASLADRINFELMQARARAMSQGVPHALRITNVSIDPLWIPVIGQPIEPVFSSLGTAIEPIPFEDYGPGVIRQVFSGNASTSLPLTIWFSIDGEPQIRDSNGVLVGTWTNDAVIEVGSLTSNTTLHTITIRRLSGLVEVQSP